MNFRGVDREALARTAASLYIKARGWFVSSLVVVRRGGCGGGGRHRRWSLVLVSTFREMRKMVVVCIFRETLSKVLKY